jgi:uncharacterized protein YndB with AHSA1/START domain
MRLPRPQSAGNGMTRIVTAVVIGAPIEQVFAFVTTPANWPRWHPASKAVSGAVDHSLKPGERLIEEVETAGYRGQASWVVREREAPVRWLIEGEGNTGGHALITYRLSVQPDGTRFERELVYRMPNAWYALLDLLFVRRRMAAQSAEALRRLKALLEAGGTPGA